LHELPESMQSMVDLVTLELSQNKLTVLPDDFAPPKLKSFIAMSNDIRYLPHSFANCKDLEVLNLESNPVDSQFWQLAGKFTRLRELLPFHGTMSKCTN
jgi:Leucine-rich repeat (LRR) protein